ncbi:MAG: Ni,Fe-hydrogenase I large subunit [Chromatiaceae bacterium]
MADFAGRLNIELRRTPDGLRAVISSSRLVSASRVFVGKTVKETVTRLPTLFSICATAQASACVAACEAALEIAADPRIADVRRLLVDGETVKEHFWRILLDWPPFLGEPPDAQGMTAVMRAHAALSDSLGGRQTLAPAAQLVRTDVTAATHAVDELSRVCADRVLGVAPAEWLATIRNQGDLLAWCRRSPTCAARIIATVVESGWVGLGSSSVAPLPALSVGELEQLLGGGDAAQLVAAPVWQGRPAEASPYSRNLGQPLVAALSREWGNGLLPRLGAQLVELAALQEALRDGLADLGSLRAEAQDAPIHGVGLAQVPAARGLLIHRAVVDRGRVTDYRILAPTEWNFHPGGVVASGLARLSAADDVTLGRQASIFVTAVDPCVDYDVFIC